MKLRNKDDGRVREFGIDETKSFPYYLRDELGNTYWAKTIKEIADKWEEIEEPKIGYIIDPMEEDCVSADDSGYEESDIERAKELGIWLETKEEAEKAVEKLKAWKRLGDIGCSFDGWNVKTAGSEGDHLLINLYVKDCTGCEEILNLLFGGEE